MTGVREEALPGSAARAATATGATSDVAVLDKSHVVKAYAQWAPFYDLSFALVFWPGRKAVVAAANRPGGLVLDVGVGTGLALPMFDKSTRLVGIDLSLPMLQRAVARVRAKALGNVEGLSIMDATRLGFPDAHFDVVIAPFFLTVVPQPHRALAELARVVKRGGEIVLVNHVGAPGGPIAWIEAQLARYSAELGWNPQFPWSILGDWIESRPDIRLLERRKIAPLGLFTLARLEKL
jgi:phosphatidylethanolamine/phosphatidyl-N-methylethanolamine N-methyltransferase